MKKAFKIGLLILVAAFLVFPSTSRADLGESLNYSLVDIEWMNTAEVADLIEFSIKEDRFGLDTAYVILRSLSDQKISGILQNLTDLTIKEYFIVELAGESHIRTARVLLKLNSETASPLLEKLDIEKQAKILETLRELDFESYEKIISYNGLELAAK